MIHRLTAALVLMAAGPIGAVGAQPIGPPKSPQQQFDAQPKPRTQLPPVYAPPVGGSARTYSTPLTTAPQQGSSRGRAADCQHQATVDRVPRNQRGAYVRNCISSQ
jgi:hypothetical protein